MVLLRYRYRVYPTAPQRASLARAFGSARVVYNDAVAARKHAHREGLAYPSTAQLSKTLITRGVMDRLRRPAPGHALHIQIFDVDALALGNDRVKASVSWPPGRQTR